MRAAGRFVAPICSAGVCIITVKIRTANARLVNTTIVGSAFIIVVASQDVCRIYAASLRKTRIVGAEIGIIAVHHSSADTISAITLVERRAEVLVIAADRVVNEKTPKIGVTGIVGTEVGIVADECLARDARASCTGIPYGANRTVVTGDRISRMNTANLDVAAIIRAEIVVIATDERGDYALARLAMVTGRTFGTIVAWSIVGCELTPGLSITEVVGARIAIVAR